MQLKHLAAIAAAGIAGFGISLLLPLITRHDRAVLDLIERSEQANDALMRGDVDRYRALVPVGAEFTLMAPFGGKPTRGAAYDERSWNAMRRLFRNGRLRQEVVQTYRSRDMVVLAVIERAHAEVGGLPAQDWNLRVTLVYRREGDTWLLVHRHADPLANGVDLETAAALAAGSLR